MHNMREIEEMNKNKRKYENDLTVHQASEECTGKIDCGKCV